MIKVYGAKAFKKELKGNIRDVRVIWALEEMGLAYEHVQLDPAKKENFSEAYLKLNPFGKVPTIEDGGFSLFESGAICLYLAEKSGKLIPRDLQAKSICQQWLLCAQTNIEPQTLRIFACDYFYDQDETTKIIRTLAEKALDRFLGPLDKIFAKQEFICHEEFTIADIMMTTCIGYAAHDPLFERYPQIRRYLDRTKSRPAYRTALEKNG